MPRKKKSAPAASVPVCGDDTIVGGSIDETRALAPRYGTVTLTYADLEKLIPLPDGMQIVSIHNAGPLTIQLVVHSLALPMTNGNTVPEIDLDIQDIFDERAGVMGRHAEITGIAGEDLTVMRKVG